MNNATSFEKSDVTVSICTVAYNHEKYIKECLESLVGQKTSFKYEILVHDDASTDSTQTIIKSLMSKYPDKINAILQTENQWVKNNRNPLTEILLPLAKGKYIALCEGDDYWIDPLKLQKQVEIFENNKEVSLVSCYARVLVGKQLKEKRKGGTRTYLFKNNQFFKRRISFFRNVPHVDTFLVEMLKTQGKVIYLDDVMAVWRKHEGGVWNSLLDSEENRIKLEFQRSVTSFWIGIMYYEEGKNKDAFKFLSKSAYKILTSIPKHKYSVLRTFILRTIKLILKRRY